MAPKAQRPHCRHALLLRMWRFLAFAGLLCFTAVNAADTEGTSFQVVFFRVQINKPYRLLNIVNNGAEKVNYTVSYWEWGTNSLQDRVTNSGFVNAGDQVPVDLSKYRIMYNTVGPGFNNYPDLRVHINTTGPVSVYATDSAVTNISKIDRHTVGDTYLVLPDSMAGREYVLTLPDALQTLNPQDLWQMKVIFLIPVSDQVKITFTQRTATGWDQETVFTIKKEQKIDQHYFAQMTGLGDSFFKITGDGDFLVLAGVTCAPDHQGDCDFAAYMPPPMVGTDCAVDCRISDDHVTYYASDQYLLSAPICTRILPYTVTDENGYTQKYNLTNIEYAGPNSAPFSATALMYSSNPSVFQMSRIGYRSKQEGGLYLDLVPATSQYVTATVYIHYSATVKVTMDDIANDITL
ncbi:hypothetical protein L596_014145 [Steinernema carpocapsae]|uniref:IgGFc-binding protein N-terminal domain-containing protein n=1 Tax=Steinernema carpocapsae TaxID=34508 RepID=A0A4V6A2N3_STECR|nr:hypothetical protein L596_014145 [Steinernema carpocapsae]